MPMSIKIISILLAVIFLDTDGFLQQSARRYGGKQLRRTRHPRPKKRHCLYPIPCPELDYGGATVTLLVWDTYDPERVYGGGRHWTRLLTQRFSSAILS